MPDGYQVSQEFRSPLDQIEPVDLIEAVVPSERLTLGALVEKGRAAAERLRAILDSLYEIAVQSDAGTPELMEVAAIIRDKEQADAERLQPGIETLEQKLATRPLRDVEVTKSFQELVDIASGRLALYRDHYDKLLKLAAERGAPAGEVLYARPVEGEIDYAELIR